MNKMIKIGVPFALLSTMIGGCTRTTGWEITLGIHPINEVDDAHKLHYGGGAIIPPNDKRRY